MSEFVKIESASKIYKTTEVEVRALNEMSFSIEEGEFCVIVGASGAGKTTLLNVLGGMDTLTCGSIFVGGENITAYNQKQLTMYRRLQVGFVFQFYNLMPNLTALENVELATEICPNALNPSATLELVGLKDRKANFPAQLSGGEQQRVSIARAVAKNPKILLCDEPTGALDYETGKNILRLLYDLCKNERKTVIVVTHNQALKAMADRTVTVKNGKAVSVEVNDNPISADNLEW